MFIKVQELKDSFIKETSATQSAIQQLTAKMEQLKGAIYAVDQILALETKAEAQDSQPQLPLEG